MEYIFKIYLSLIFNNSLFLRFFFLISIFPKRYFQIPSMVIWVWFLPFEENERTFFLIIRCKANLTCTPLDIFLFALTLITITAHHHLKQSRTLVNYYIGECTWYYDYYNNTTTNPITESELHAPHWRVGLPAAIPPTKRGQSQSAFVRHRSLSRAPNLLRLAGDGIKSTRPSLHRILQLHVKPFSGKIFDATDFVKFRLYSVLSVICENTLFFNFPPFFFVDFGSNLHWVTSIPFLRVFGFTL